MVDNVLSIKIKNYAFAMKKYLFKIKPLSYVSEVLKSSWSDLLPRF